MQPRLREVRAQPTVYQERRGVVISDPLGISPAALFVPTQLVPLLALMDGTRDMGTLRTSFELRYATPVGTQNLEQLVSVLDEALLLDNQRFAQAYASAVNEFRSAPSRPFTLPGRCCPADPRELSAFLQQLLDQVEDPSPCAADSLQALICPHIDFPRGGPVYAGVWARTREALRQAELIVVLGTDHSGGDSQITLTQQSYETPWGIIPTDRDLVDRIAKQAGEGVFGQELHHRSEHSVESAAIWLHHLLDGQQCLMLPVLCGSFQPFIDRGQSPSVAASISSTVEAIGRAAETRRTVLVAAADLAHVGPAFGDPVPLDAAAKAGLEVDDRRMMDLLCLAEPEPFFEEIKNEGDRRRICGMPPIYVTLSILSGVRGYLTGYDQCPASTDGGSLVSICGMIYESEVSYAARD